METYNLYKKRDGQDYKLVGEIYASNFDEAKKEFAKECYNDLLNGVHGDNFIELSEITDNVDQDGIYYFGELFLSNLDLHEGFECFSEDVYTWELRDNKN